MNAPTVGFVSLGCAKATVDSERILTQLKAEGYGFSANYEHADLVVVNTCGFIESAVDESLDVISQALGANGRVIVTGCLGVKAGLLKKKFPNLLAITGPQDCDAVMAAVHAEAPPVHEPFYHLLPPGGVKLTPRHYAYLKIAEGCNHKCTFCIIPTMRGRLVSRAPSDVLGEAKSLVDAGVRELLVVSQDTSAYGVDQRGRADLATGRALRPHITDLAQALGELGVWVRLHYVYPYPHVDELVELMASGIILPYLDVPFQHASPRILRLMKRPASGEDNLARVHAWRERCPSLAIRSTFIVGFPGETDTDFQELLNFLRQAQLDRVGCFIYSPVTGARANDLPEPVDSGLAQARFDELMAVQAEISHTRLRQRVGRECKVLIDEVTEAGAVGRSASESPDVDGVIHLPGVTGIQPGDLVKVEITACDTHDLTASLIEV